MALLVWSGFFLSGSIFALDHGRAVLIHIVVGFPFGFRSWKKWDQYGTLPGRSSIGKIIEIIDEFFIFLWSFHNLHLKNSICVNSYFI